MDVFVFVLMAAIGLLSVSCSVGGLMYLYSKFTEQMNAMKAEMARLKKDIRGVCTGAVGISHRLNSLEGNLQDLNVRQDSTEMKEPGFASYSHAIKMVEMGGSIEDVVKSCGLNRAEAELVSVLHRKKG